MNRVFDNYARYYDLLYRDKDYCAESEYIAGRIRKKLPKANSILELGCGTGAHAEYLARMGYIVHGIDLSENMLALAEARKASLPAELAARLSFGVDDVRSLRIDQTFDAVISLFHVVSYQSSNAELQEIVATAASHLNPGGLFLFDFWYGPAVLTQVPEIRIKRLQDDTISVTRIAEPSMHVNENIVDVKYDIFVEDKASGGINRIQEEHKMRYIFAPELPHYLDAETWSKFEACEWLSDAELSNRSWSAFVVAARK